MCAARGDTYAAIVTVEENVVAGGAGSAVDECLAATGIESPIHHIGIPDRFIEHGSREDCLVMAGLDAVGLERAVMRLWAAHNPRGPRPSAAFRSITHSPFLPVAPRWTGLDTSSPVYSTQLKSRSHRSSSTMAAQRPCSAQPRVTSIEDVQGRADSRQIPINKVGIKDIYHPVRVKDRSGGEQHTVANFNMYVALPHNFKGTHMSRFVEVLHQHEREISVESFRQILVEMTRTARRRRRVTSR